MILTLGRDPHTIDLDFTIPESVPELGTIDKIGVLLSGGLDSTALLCMIISELQATKRIDKVSITAFTLVKGDGGPYYAARMLEKIKAHFGVEIEHVNNVANDEFATGRVGRGAWLYIQKQNPTMLFYQGVNRQAPADIKEFNNALAVNYREDTFNMKSPFLDMLKPQILDIYYQLECEELIPYSHSCTETPVDRCDECYACEERQWAFDVLGEVNPPTTALDIDDITAGGTWTYKPTGKVAEIVAAKLAEQAAAKLADETPPDEEV